MPTGNILSGRRRMAAMRCGPRGPSASAACTTLKRKRGLSPKKINSDDHADVERGATLRD